MPRECRECGGEECHRPCSILKKVGDKYVTHHRHDVFELQTCASCIGEVRSGLFRIRDLHKALPVFLANLRSAQLDNDRHATNDAQPLPGGDVLALLGPGSDGAAAGGYPHARDAWPSDKPSVSALLASWVDDWMTLNGDVKTPTTVPEMVDYLNRRLGWAAQHHLAFPDFASDVQRLRNHLEQVTYTSDRPEPVNAYCTSPGCSQRLYRKLNEKSGFDDNAYCPKCQRVYEPRELAFAYRAWMEERVAEREAS